VAGVQATLYGFSISNPANTARLMLAYKGVETKWVELPPGIHPLILKLLGYRRGTVPAVKLDGRKIEDSVELSHALERLAPDPPLFPADPAKRRAVEEAERWGEAELQMIPRRIFRWTFAHHNDARARLARDIGFPLPGLVARLNAPVAKAMAGRVDADLEHARAALAAVPEALDKVDGWIADGTLGDPEAPNAADFQIAPSIRALAGVTDLLPLLAGRPCDAHARRLLPRFPEGRMDLPPQLKAAAGS
jgi:glutathione S-transferase